MQQSWIVAIMASVLWTGCTDSDLFLPPFIREIPLDNTIDVHGSFCAEGAEDLDAFLKIMLVVDRSNSMNVTDRNNQRIKAAQDLVLRFVEDPVTLSLKGGVEFAIISFYGDVVVHTRDERGLPGYSTDGPSILASLTQIAITSSNTGYDKALAQAFLMLDTDMAKLSDKARTLSRYETIFLSDGMPFPDNCYGEANSPSAAVEAVERIRGLSSLHRVGHTLHTAFASHPGMFTPGNDVDPCRESDPFEQGGADDTLGSETRSLLQAMANAGDGTFTQFDNGDSISFEGFEFGDARRIYALSNFIVANLNARPNLDHMLPDSDADGVPDGEETLLGTNPFDRDTDGDGFHDAMEIRFRVSGLDPVDPSDAQCDELGILDTDGDTLRDCEEAYLGTFRRAFDSDADGLPDPIELMFGGNAKSATPMQDLQSDADADGGTNADEIRWHTDPVRDDIARRAKIAYNYSQWEDPVTGGHACYGFAVTNITLASTGEIPVEQVPPGSPEVTGWNRVMMYFAQRPYDDPLGPPIYRLACVDTRYVEDRDLKVPANGIVELAPQRPSDTYRASSVLRPNRDQCHASVNQDCGLTTLWCRFEQDGSCQCKSPPQAPTDSPDGINPRPCPVCSNGVDDDGDGLTDFPFDPDCFDSTDDNEGPTHACSNGVDDDGDGRIDWPDDPGCDGGYDTDETTPAALPECSDGVDNDADGGVDFPNDPGCYAAVDGTEGQSLTNPAAACGDGLDNDGDGLVDLADAGCSDATDLDEDGPAVCFFCENFSDTIPGQCDIGAGFCKARSGTPPAGNCATNADCRGGICDPSRGSCSRCIRDSDCGADGVCDSIRGWCLTPVFQPQACTSDSDCAAGRCDLEVGFCTVDPFFACKDDKDCRPSEICSEERGFCLKKVFTTRQCGGTAPCATGLCDTDLGWCLPETEDNQCKHSDECPFGDCTDKGYCEQQTFVVPEDFRPDIDCITAD